MQLPHSHSCLIPPVFYQALRQYLAPANLCFLRQCLAPANMFPEARFAPAICVYILYIYIYCPTIPYAVLWFVQSYAGCFPELPMQPLLEGDSKVQVGCTKVGKTEASCTLECCTNTTLAQVKLLNIQHKFAQPLQKNPYAFI